MTYMVGWNGVRILFFCSALLHVASSQAQPSAPGWSRVELPEYESYAQRYIPASASSDQFSGYEHRGDSFRQIVESYQAEAIHA